MMSEHNPDIRKPIVLALLVIGVSFGSFFLWAVFSPLESAAVATGKLSSEGKQKTIEHLEGGIVESILVQDGEQVVAGDVLIRLDKTQSQANLDFLVMRMHNARALRARLIAERDGHSEIVFSDALVNNEMGILENIVQGQRNIFKGRLQVTKEKESVMNRQIAQYYAEVDGLKGEIGFQSENIDLTEEEIQSYLSLERKGMSAGKIRLNALQRQLSEQKGARSKNLAAISRSRQKVAETELRIRAFKADMASEVVQELREVESTLFDLQEKILAAEDVLARTDIRVPVDGTVVGLQVHSQGAVVSPGEALMGIVPDNRMLVETRINPMDIDVVRAGLAAHVRLTALSSRNYPTIEARVLKVSADRFTDERTGEAFYEAEVSLQGDLSRWQREDLLHPGMQAEVMIVTGTKTPLQYFLEPVLQSFNRAFREG
jgi:membrane fusion protein, type I secretion system